MRHKTFELIEVKAEGQEGQFSALASVFNNVDLVGDRMLPGAFSKTLEKWRASGDPIPVVLSHQWDDPMAYVGKADPRAVVETDEGLLVQGQLDTSTPVGKQVYRLMKDRLLKAWSFGYTVPEGGESFKDGVNNVSEADLIEVGPTLKGANPEAQTLAVKAVDMSPNEVKQDTMGEAHIQRMIEMAQAFIDSEPDAEDRKAMRSVLDALRAMGQEEQTEPADEGKATWNTAYVNNLPDSAFLYVEPGGSKDGEGKTTPRSLRHFPYKDDQGNVDLPHLRNALARIPQSNLPQSVKDRLTAQAQKILDNSKSVPIEDAAAEEPAERLAKVAAQDPLRKRSEDLALELMSGGLSLRKPPKVKEEPKPEPPSERDLRRRSEDLIVQTLSGLELSK